MSDPTDDVDTGRLSFDRVDSQATIVTQGEPVQSFVDSLSWLVDEAILQFDDDGVNVAAVDPANVCMMDVDWLSEGMVGYTFDADGTVRFGANMDRLRDALSLARVGRGNSKGDPVRIDVVGDGAPHLRVSVLRPDQGVKRTTKFMSIEPDSMRQPPEQPSIAQPYKADPDIDALKASLRVQKANTDHVRFRIKSNTFYVDAWDKADDVPTDSSDFVDTVEFADTAWHADEGVDYDGDGTGSLFSMDYLKDMVDAVDKAKASRLTINFGDGVPVDMGWDVEDWSLRGQFMLAPRISSDDD